jgi:hypothetical protein
MLWAREVQYQMTAALLPLFPMPVKLSLLFTYHRRRCKPLQDLYPEIFRFTVSLFPSEDDDVVTSPYNSVLALSELVDHASAVLPIENQALLDVVRSIDNKLSRSASRSTSVQEVDLVGKGMRNSKLARIFGSSNPFALIRCIFSVLGSACYYVLVQPFQEGDCFACCVQLLVHMREALNRGLSGSLSTCREEAVRSYEQPCGECATKSHRRHAF